MTQQATLRIALAGNPNAGKTTLFNAITGSRQKVGNYPGVTVERKEGQATHRGATLHIIDLPGTYSLTPHSDEEVVARNVLIDDQPDAVIDIVDCSNLQRNLYLAVQLMELGAPLVLAFNMYDVAREQGLDIDLPMLSQLLGAAIIPTVGRNGEGVAELLDAAVAAAGSDQSATQQTLPDRRQAMPAGRQVDYGPEIEPHVQDLQTRIAAAGLPDRLTRWFAVRLLENDHETVRRIRNIRPESAEELHMYAQKLRRHIEGVCGGEVEIVLAQRRHGFIAGALRETVRQGAKHIDATSHRIDAVLTSRIWGLPIFAVVIFLMFQLTFTLGNPLVDLLSDAKDAAAVAVRAALQPHSVLLASLLADGIIEGVGAVLTFVPLVVLLFLAIAILEDTGYMARAAFITDNLMHRVGLHGRSFIPLLIGFGCTVPAVMATRIISGKRDRLVTMLALPLISCSARLPIYLLILGAFFPARPVLNLGVVSVTNQAMLLMGIYLCSIVLTASAILVLRKTVLRGESLPFVMELPAYRLPTLRGLLLHAWERTWMYVRKAGTLILAAVIVLWALNTWPGLPQRRTADFDARRQAVRADAGENAAELEARLSHIDSLEAKERLEQSAIGRIGRAIEPALRPCGFDERVATALIGALAAKEVFVGQMGVIHAVGSDGGDLRSHLAAEYTALQGFCMMIFCLICSPCLATTAVVARESGSWLWAGLQWIFLAGLAWTLTAGVYQLGMAMGWG